MAEPADGNLKAAPDSLARLMALGRDQSRLWRPDELAAIFRHQMSAPVVFDLGGLSEGMASRVRMLSEADALLLKSFEDLFTHPSPPIELLTQVRDFAKLNRDHPESALPADIASMLFYLSISAAWIRCGARLTRLGGEELKSGLRWALAQPWIDETARTLLRTALEKL